ncbi:MAG: hypothetical protein KAJ51_13165, partial [Thermoplasmata archaeon]|nr:hypothetical protein [Thermoplasmata archaeon]
EGFIVFLVITLISVFLSILTSLVIPLMLHGGSDALSGELVLIISLIPFLAIPFGLIMLYVVGWLTAKLARSIGNGFEDVEKTVAFFGYAAIVGLIISIIQLLVNTAIGLASVPSLSPDYAYSLTGSYYRALGSTILLALIAFVWNLYVYGTATSVANDISVGAGMATYLIAMIIIVIIIVVVTAIFALFLFAFLFPFS